MTPEIQGYCSPRFARVRRAFAALFERGAEAGAGVGIYLGDELVTELWAGDADPRAGRAWQRDTPCLAFSCAKAVTAACALQLCSRANIDVNDPVAQLWPEFAVAGKERTTIAHLLSHQAGLPAFSDRVTVPQSADAAALAARLAAQAPEWEPGTAHGYHALTFGWLAGEIVRRLSGLTVGEYLAQNLAAQGGLELWLGGPAEVIGRAARLTRTGPGRTGPGRTGQGGRAGARLAGAAGASAESGSARVFFNPDATSVPGGSNNPAVLQAGWPASGLLATARGLAGFYRALLSGPILAPAELRAATTVRASGRDRVLAVDSAFGLGFMLASPVLWVPPSARQSAFGHTGLSGALGIADPARGLAFGYVTRLMGDKPTTSARAARLLSAAYSSIS